jgi:hypothetical protein
MARCTYGPEIRARVIQRYRSGESLSAIAMDEDMDRKTVRKYLQEAEDGAAASSPRRRSVRRTENPRRVSDEQDDEPSTDEPPKMHWIGMLALGGIAAAGIVLAARGNSVTEFPENSAPWRADVLTPE